MVRLARNCKMPLNPFSTLGAPTIASAGLYRLIATEPAAPSRPKADDPSRNSRRCDRRAAR
jgi:hypothetical protein